MTGAASVEDTLARRVEFPILAAGDEAMNAVPAAGHFISPAGRPPGQKRPEEASTIFESEAKRVKGQRKGQRGLTPIFVLS